MPKNKGANWRNIHRSIDAIDLQMKDAYNGTYHADKSNSMNIAMISDDIIGKLDKMISSNSDIQGIPNISKLYNRLSNAKSSVTGEKFTEDIFSMFDDKAVINNLMDSYAHTRSIQMFDNQIDTICKYMPKLEDALVIKRDNILSADNFTKDYINLMSGLNRDDKSFASRAESLKEKYNIQEFFDDIALNTSKYGETFIYCVPYKKAISDLLNKRKGRSGPVIPASLNKNESAFITESIIESGSFVFNENANDKALAEAIREYKSDNTDGSLKLNIKVGMIEEVIADINKADMIKKRIPKGIYEQYVEENALLEASGSKDDKKITFNKIISDELEYDIDSSANDGLVDKTSNSNKGIAVNTPGCIIKKLDRSHVLPIYIENMCLGYYYIEYVSPGFIDSTSVMKDGIVHNKAMENDTTDDKLIKFISSKISSKLDSSFINANADLSKEIYMILKYDEKFNMKDPNGMINASFIPADDIFHHYYQLDPKTHRGISDLYKGMVPATIWCLLTLCTAIGIITRGQDKRVYYVQQSGVETNVSKTLMSVVNQLKKGNFGVRQMESINNILGIVGRFNDHVVPVGPSGEPPIRFEIMQGQNIETPTDLLTQMEENAINSTDVPLEIVNSSKQMDFAIHYSQSNAKFLTIVYKRQAKEQIMQSKIITKIYNCEYQENSVIKVMLPAPKTLSMTQGSQLLDQTKQYVQSLVETYCYDMNDTEKAEFTNIAMRHYLPSHVDVNSIDNMKSMARIAVAVKPTDNEEQQ